MATPAKILRPVLATARQPIYLYDSIGFFGDNAKSVVIEQIIAAGTKPIDLHINSPGGSIFDGYAIYNALLNHKPGVTVYIDGLAASIASYIAMAGNPIVMAENALIMVHNPMSEMPGGDADELRKQADLLDKITISMTGAYARRTGLPLETITEMLDEETWLDAETAKAFGFVDEISEPLELAASFDTAQLSKFKNIPQSLKAKLMEENTTANPDKPQINTDETRTDNPEIRDNPCPSVAKQSLFTRIAAIVKEKGTLAEVNARHQSEIEARDKTIGDLKSKLEQSIVAVAEGQKQIKAYQDAEAELKEALATSESENKSVADGVTAQVAALGFDQTKLPPQVSAEDAEKAKEAADPKTEKEWLDKINAIADSGEQMRFIRENSTKMWACRMQERAAKNK